METSWTRELEVLSGAPERLRALARALVGDAGAADDLAQQAWVVALARPAPRGTLLPWLLGIVRRLGRAERRRRAQGPAVGLPHDQASAAADPAALVEAAELQRRVLEAVTTLEEPYRQTVLLHFFHGLSLVEIGRRLGVNDSTVRSRLQRALERLRARLDAACGDRDAWCALLAPLAAPAGSWVPGSAAAAHAAEATVMGMKVKLAAGVAALAAITTLVIQVQEADLARNGAPLVARAEGIGTAGAAPESAPSREAQVEETRRAAAPPAPPASPGPAEALVYGAFRSSAGEPLASGWIRFVGPEGGERTEWEASLGAGGSYSLFGLAPGRWSVHANAPECVPLHDTVELLGPADGERHDLVLQHVPSLLVRFETPGGETLRRARPRDEVFPVAVATLELPGPSLPDVEGAAPFFYGVGPWHPREEEPELPPEVSGRLELNHPLPVHVSLVLRNTVLETRLVVSAEEPVTFVIEAGRLAAQLATARVKVTDAAGSPLTEGTVALHHVAQTRPGVAPDAAGVVSFTEVLPGWMEVVPSFTGYERARRRMLIRAGAENDLGTLVLDRAATLRGRVIGPDGAPAKASLWAYGTRHLVQPLDVRPYRYWQTEGGRFELDGMGRGDIVVVVAPETDVLIPFHVDTSAGEAEVELRLPATVAVRFEAGQTLRAPRRLTLADERGTPFWTTRVMSEAPGTLGLAPGRYTLWIGEEDRVDATVPFTVESGAAPVVLEIGELVR